MGRLHSIMQFTLGEPTLLNFFWKLGPTLHLSTLTSVLPYTMLQGLDSFRKYIIKHYILVGSLSLNQNYRYKACNYMDDCLFTQVSGTIRS